VPHDDFLAAEIVPANKLQVLDEQGTYTPTLTAVTTNPTLGTGSSAVGWWQRNGHFITGETLFTFGTAGVAAGSGAYMISLPFAPDLSLMSSSSIVPGATSQLGTAFFRDSDTAANRTPGLSCLGTLSGVSFMFLVRSDVQNALVTNAVPFTWAASDQISANFRYIADPAGLP
jgi:hypothetical protein